MLVDTASSFVAAAVHGELRRWSGQRLHTAVYSHGHIDHVFGVPVWEAESAERGWPEPVVIAHEALPARFDRYIMTAGYNEVINQRQFGVPGLRWPVEYRYPDRTYRDQLRIEVGGTGFELLHEKGETDDHTVTWVPRPARAVLRGLVHLGVAQRRQPAEGAALPQGVGRLRCAG